MFTNSIRWRLQLWLGFLLVCTLSGFGVTAYQLHRTNQLNQIDQALKHRVEVLSGALRTRFGPEGRPSRRPSLNERTGPARLEHPNPASDSGREIVLPAHVLSLFDESTEDSFYFVLWSRNGTLMQRSVNAPQSITDPPTPTASRATFNRLRGSFRESFYFNSLGECVLVGRDITSDFAALGRFSLWLLAAGATVLALGLSGGWWLTTRAIRPVEDISAAASRISAGNLSERITGTEDNELGRLAAVLNNTFARLEAAFTQQKQFTADASHELRTPISVLICEAQTALARERTNAEYKETIEGNLATAQQMRQLTESLLTLARYDTKHEPLKCETFNLADKARECVERIRPLADQHRIRIHEDLAVTACYGDPARLDQVLTNLLTNAIHYNREGGDVRVSTRPENGTALFTVADTGVGLAAADLAHVFERFYRADKSRSSSGGHSGLGLAISKAIVDAHGGSITAESEVGLGSKFTVRLPAAGQS